MGCGLIRRSGDIFFTKNGEFQGVAATISTNTSYDLFPTIQLGEGIKARLNYGQSAFEFALNKKHYKQKAPTAGLNEAHDPQVGLFAGGIPLPMRNCS